jgi:hypothetical protein
MAKQDVLNIDYFEEDINSFKDQKNKNENLYDEIHKLYKMILGDDESPSYKNLRDLSEISKTLSSIRGTSIEAANKLFQAKLAISNLELKKTQKNDESKSSEDLARSIVAMIRSDSKERVAQKTDTQSTKDLDKRISSSLDNGEITLTENDKAMRYAQKHINFVYNKHKKLIQATLDDGSVLEDYPRNRMPQGKIVDQKAGEVTLSTGIKLKIV